MKTVENLVVGQAAQAHVAVDEPLVQCFQNGCEGQCVAAFVENGGDAVGLFFAVAGNVNGITIGQVFGKLFCYQIEIFVEQWLWCGAEIDVVVGGGVRFAKFDGAKTVAQGCQFVAGGETLLQRGGLACFVGFDQCLVVHHVGALAHKTQIVGADDGVWLQKLEQRHLFAAQRVHVGDDGYLLLFFERKLFFDVECANAFHFVAEQVDAERQFVGKREYVDDASAYRKLAGLVHKIDVFEP